jgi:hypothetical protein
MAFGRGRRSAIVVPHKLGSSRARCLWRIEACGRSDKTASWGGDGASHGAGCWLFVNGQSYVHAKEVVRHNYDEHGDAQVHHHMDGVGTAAASWSLIAGERGMGERRMT